MIGHINEGGTLEHTVQDGMQIDWDLELVMEDGVILRADVFRPVGEGKYPLLLTYGPYGKSLHFKDGFPRQWHIMNTKYKEALEGSSNKYMNWETPDPERWVRDGYVIVRIDSRGAGRSEGRLDCWSPREARDIYNCIELLAGQPYCSGKVGMLGISYYAVTQWAAAALNPPHLAAICPVEGANDMYREIGRHGGMISNFAETWWARQVDRLLHGRGENGLISSIDGKPVTGPQTWPPEKIGENVVQTLSDAFREHEMLDDWFADRIADLSKITIPVLSSGNWGGNALHLRGNVEGYIGAGSREKWLELHGLEHFTEFYTPYGLEMQKRFFDHFLKGLDTWHQASVHLRLRHVDGTFTDRDEQEWPIARTRWTRYYLDLNGMTLTTEQPKDGSVTFYARSNGMSFFTAPLEEELELTGNVAAKLFIQSSTVDADLFVTLRVLDPDGRDIVFISAGDPKGVVATGWLRASHRKLDQEKSLPYRPWHTHDEKQPLIPGQTYELDVEVWPTSIIIPAGYRLGVAISGKDFEVPNYGAALRGAYGPYSGNGVYTHADPADRGSAVYDGDTTLVAEGGNCPFLLLPVIPKEESCPGEGEKGGEME